MSKMWTEKKGIILKDGTSVDLKRLAEYLNIVEDERSARQRLAKETTERMELQAKKSMVQFKIIANDAEKKKTALLAIHKERKAKAKALDDEVKNLLNLIEDDFAKVAGIIKK
jgi:hypothetical protein